jgi:hypothetical protein
MLAPTMKVFIITSEGEQGPLTAAQINRLYARGKLKPDQLCRVEGIEGNKPIHEVFRHLAAPNQEVVAATRNQVAAYNRDEGNSGVATGWIMVFMGICFIIFFNPFNVGFGLLIVGVGFIVRGQAQLRRGEKALAELRADGKKLPDAIGQAVPRSVADAATAEQADTANPERKSYDY